MRVKDEMERTRGIRPLRQVAPSMDHSQHNYNGEPRQLVPSEVKRRKLFSEVLKDEGGRRYSITLKAKDNSQTAEQIKTQLKKDINPTDINAGIKTLKTLRGGKILIETCSEEEVNSLSREINTKYGEQL